MNARVLRVYVLDDNRDAADSLAMLIQLWGFQVQCGYSGSALDEIHSFEPDVILLDIGLPKMDGNSIARTLREMPSYAQTLIIAVSGYHDEVRQRFAREAGVDHYLIKPVDPSVLEKLLQLKLMSLRSPGT